VKTSIGVPSGIAPKRARVTARGGAAAGPQAAVNANASIAITRADVLIGDDWSIFDDGSW
jgi:hypothetical protein